MVSVLDFQRLMSVVEEHREKFAKGQPFPHVIIDNFLPEALADQISAEYSGLEDRWKHYHHINEKKLALTDIERIPPRARSLFDALQSQEFVDFIGRLSGIERLVADPDLEGAGMHMVREGGFLNIHADFLTHTKRRSWSRQINLLLYLNRDWQEEWQGNLELWSGDMQECVVSTAPVFNRCVVFNTLPDSFHGHPKRLTCPEGTTRKSIAIYYYREEGVTGPLQSTNYQALPSDSTTRRALIGLDRAALAFYTFIKGRLKISDDMISRILKRF